METIQTLIDKSRAGRRGTTFPKSDVPSTKPEKGIPAQYLRREPCPLPEVGHLDIMRHYVNLSRKNFSIDNQFYPLGSCTMKYNPRINEAVAALPSFRQAHPLAPDEAVQGFLEVVYSLERYLSEIAGMDEVCLQPAAGAHGEMTGVMVIRAYHESRGDKQRNEMLIPDSAHGTNPASCTVCGLETVTVKSGEDGLVDLEDLKSKLSEKTAGFMITNPNTLGIFEKNIAAIADLVHEAGGLVYMDGANLNAILGRTRPGDFGMDVLHFNLHKTFSTPHGGGGPGAGPIGVKKHLKRFLPVPRVRKGKQGFHLENEDPMSIGRIRSFFGSSGVLLRAYTYIRANGREGLSAISENAVINANYLLSKLRGEFDLYFKGQPLHEFVLSARRQKKEGVTALHIAKRLLDLGFHAPTIYFPLIVPEAMMIEPTETENRETLDAFAEGMLSIARDAKENPENVTSAPLTMPVRKLDEVGAARNPVVRWSSGLRAATSSGTK